MFCVASGAPGSTGAGMPRAPAEGKRGFGGWEVTRVPKGHAIQRVIFGSLWPIFPISTLPKLQPIPWGSRGWRQQEGPSRPGDPVLEEKRALLSAEQNSPPISPGAGLEQHPPSEISAFLISTPCTELIMLGPAPAVPISN